jgi:MFS superfamily sulfate permease-like transporter
MAAAPTRAVAVRGAGTGRRALRRLLPGLADLAGYRRAWLRSDVLAGLAVWAILVPQGLAYGELAGLSPVTGLYTALGALLLYPLIGSSRYLHVGPESSIAIVTAATIGGLAAGAPERGAALASMLALVAAGFLVLGAVLRLAVVARPARLSLRRTAVLREQVLRLVDESTPPVREVVLDAEGIVDMDITGAETLDELMDGLEERGIRLVLARTRTALRDTLRQLDLEERIGPENFHLRVRDAVAAFADRASG